VRWLAARLALATASVALVLGTAELLMRALDVGQIMTYQADPRFGYLMRASQRISTYGEVISINSLGLRGPELRDPKPPDVLRVLFMGDSITYGGGRIRESELFCRRFEALAAANGLRIEAVNGSAPGWSPQNWAAWLEVYGTLDADLVLLVLPAIDLRRPFTTMEKVGVVDHQPTLRLGTLWLKLEMQRIPGLPLTNESLDANIAALRSVLARFPKTPFLAVFIESRPGDDGPRPSYWGPYEQLFPEAVDLRTSLGLPDFFDDVHLTAVGHASVARLMWAQLEPRLRELLAARAARPR
jgi:lysophospholipase L1-like esterase